MKQIFTLFFALCLTIFSFGQTNENLTVKRSAYQAPIQTGSADAVITPRSIDCIWESDFSNSSDWVIDHDAADCSLDWEIGSGLECEGFYPITTIESANGSYAMLDSDEYGGEEGGTEVEDSWLTMANAADLSNYDNVIVEFDTWYRSYNSEKCFLVVSTDGTFPEDLTPDSDADPANGIYEIFPGISGDAGADLGDNPSTVRINITEAAAGQSQVWIRFNWTGTWGYAWFIDRVCIAEQPNDDIEMSYGAVSFNNTAYEYGRTPVSQLGTDISVSCAAYNFGVNAQDNVSVNMVITDADGYEVASTDNFTAEEYNDGLEDYVEVSGSMDNDAVWYFNGSVPSLPVGNYQATFTVSSDGDMDGADSFVNNTAVREFAITESVYSTDGIGVYSNSSIGSLGTGSFGTESDDGFMMFNYYDMPNGSNIEAVEILLDQNNTTPGGEFVVHLLDTNQLFSSQTVTSQMIAAQVKQSSDFYLITQSDIDNGSITVQMPGAWLPAGSAYLVGVEMYSESGQNPIRILDDETVPQPGSMSMIYIVADNLYTNGEAFGIRLITGSGGNANLEEADNHLSIYPNPTNGIVNINMNENSDISIIISDVLGKIVKEKIINSNTTLDLSNLEKGVYFIESSNGENTQTQQLIVE